MAQPLRSEAYAPPLEWAANAHICGNDYADLYRQSLDNPGVFWAAQADLLLSWHKRWEEGAPLSSHNFDTDAGPIRVAWFEGAELNLSYNCLDRHVEAGKGDRVAFHW